MEMGSVEGATVTLIGLAATFVASVGSAGWWFRGIKADVDARVDRKVQGLKDEILSETGEGLKALKEKVNLMELDTERNFTRRSDFQNAIDSFTRSISDLRADIKSERAEIRAEYQGLSNKLDEFIRVSLAGRAHG
jgi:hypothetical protein